MNELVKTLTFVAVALVLTGAAFVTTRDRTPRNARFDDQGQPFFPASNPPVEVAGHHFVVGPDGRFGPHTDVLYGTALDSDGRYYTGWHHHPNGTELAQFEHREESPFV